MFNKKNESEVEVTAAVGNISTIANGMVIQGDVEATGDIRIDGRVEGNIFCKGKVVLGAAGIVDGDLSVTNADIFGTVNGNVTAKDLLVLKTKCVINGNLNVGRLNIEPQASFNGQCKMVGEGKNSTAVKEAKAILANHK